MDKISIILPTRNRQSLIYRLLDSIVKTTDNPQDLEIIIYIDEDDLESQNISYPSLSIVKLIGPQRTMVTINNICYRASTGKYIFLMNDDVVFQTPHWDTTIVKALEQFPDGIALLYGNDLHRGKGMPTFPILPRTVCELMDGICPSEYIRFLIDYRIFDIFKRLSSLGYNRIFYLENVIFEHMHYSLGKAPSDNTYFLGNNINDEMLFFISARERYYIALKLAQHIRNCKRDD